MKTTISRAGAVLLILAMCALAFAQAAAETAGMPSPWSEAPSAQAAANAAGVEDLLLPQDGTQTSGGAVHWLAFRSMTGIAEADGVVGSADLMARKGLREDALDVSGDYTEYDFHWTVEAEGRTVDCYGFEEGCAMKAIWLSGRFCYSILVRGRGELALAYGLDDAAVALLAAAIQ